MDEKIIVKYAQKFMKIFNVSPKSLGYKYLTMAAILVYNNPALINGGKCGLYAVLAKIFPDSKPSSIMHTITASLRRGFDFTDSKTLSEYFGNVLGIKTGYPSTLVFVATMNAYIHDELEGEGNSAGKQKT